MEIFNARRITHIGIVAAMYVAITLVFSFISYGNIQFRISEIFMLLCFFNKDYIISVTLGCFIANIFSSLGMIDTAVGTSATLISAVLIYLCRKDNSTARLYLCSLFPVIANGFLVAAELKYVMNLPFWLSVAQVAFGEFVCVTIVGVAVVKLFTKNRSFMRLIMSGSSTKTS